MEVAHGEAGKAVLTHALGLLTLVLGPLALYFAFRRNASPWLRGHLAGSVNDGLLTFGLFVLALVALVLLSSSGGAVTVIALVLLLVVLLHVAARAMALVQSVRGRAFHVPLTPPLVR